MKLKNVIACLAVLAFVSGSTCAMAKNVDNQQKVENQEKIKKVDQSAQTVNTNSKPKRKRKNWDELF